MYCSRCGAAMVDTAAFCSSCGQSFSVAAAVPLAGSVATVPGYAAAAAATRVEYAGFWLRFLAYFIDNALLGIAFVLILIPFVFLTGLGGLVREIHRNGDMSDVGLFTLIGLLFLAATASLLLTWLYHALMESSEWQATVGKKVLGLVVTDMAGQRVSFGRSTGRHFAKIITNMVPALIGYIMTGFTEKKQALHDMIAGCLILRRS